LRPAFLAGDRAPRLATAAIVVVAWAGCLILNWPGHFSWDSVMQLAEGRQGAYSGQHPPVMSWLLGLADAAHRGAVLFVVLDATLVFGALLILTLIARPASWFGAPVAAALACAPQLAVYPAIVWKDVLFAGSVVAGFACLAWAARAWTRPPWRWSLLGAGLVLLALGALSRQNGVVVLPFAAAAVGCTAARAKAWRGLGYGLGFLAGAAAILLTATAALDARLTGSQGVAEQWEHLEIYDVVGAVARDPHYRLGVLAERAPWLASMLRDDAVPLYSPSRIDSLEDDILDPLDHRQGVAAPIAAQWRDLVLRHPLLYLGVRVSVFRWTLLTPRPAECVMISTGVDGDAAALAAAGLAERQTARDEAIEAYALALVATPIYSHGTYAVVGVLLMALLLRRRRSADVVVAAMVAAALAFAATFALISIACDYRYLYGLDLSVIAAALYAAASGVWRSNR
jgi:uncharacterized protein (TIGR03382 family)